MTEKYPPNSTNSPGLPNPPTYLIETESEVQPEGQPQVLARGKPDTQQAEQPGGELVPAPSHRQPPADQHPARVYLASLSAGSRPAMRGSLQVVAELLTSGRCGWETMPWQLLRVQHTQALRSELADRYAAATANKMLAALRGVLRAAWELNQIDTDSYQRAVSVRAVRGETVPRGRSITKGELRALFGVCLRDRTPMGARDAALLAVLYGSGLRRAEAAALDVTDYEYEYEAESGSGSDFRVRRTAGESRQGEQRADLLHRGGRAAVALGMAQGACRSGCSPISRPAVPPHGEGWQDQAAAAPPRCSLDTGHCAEESQGSGGQAPDAPRFPQDHDRGPAGRGGGHCDGAEARRTRTGDHHRPLRQARRGGEGQSR